MKVVETERSRTVVEVLIGFSMEKTLKPFKKQLLKSTKRKEMTLR